MDFLKTNWNKSVMGYRKGDFFFSSFGLTEFVTLSKIADPTLFFPKWGDAKHPGTAISLLLLQQQCVITTHKEHVERIWGSVVSTRHLSYGLIPHNSLTSRCYFRTFYGLCFWHFFLCSPALEATLMPMERGSIDPCRSSTKILVL